MMFFAALRTRTASCWDLSRGVDDHWYWRKCIVPVQSYGRNSTTNCQLETVTSLFVH